MQEKVNTLEQMLIEHIQKEEEKFSLYERALFGDKKLGEVGMVEKTNEMYEFLMGARHVGKFFGGFKGAAAWLLLFVSIVALFKGWWVAIISFLESR